MKANATEKKAVIDQKAIHCQVSGKIDPMVPKPPSD